MTKHKLATGLIKTYMNLNGFKGWTSFWDTIYYIDKESLNNESLRKHEMAHIEQIKKEGKIKFSVKYLYYSIKYGYLNNSYEIEARKAERQ